MNFTVDHCDAVEWLNRQIPGSIDLIITDPAYESLEKHRKTGTTTRLAKSDASSNEWFDIFPNARFPALFDAAHRALAKSSHLYVLCDVETMFVAKPMAEAAGFTFWNVLVWDKKKIGMGYHYRRRWEAVLFFEKGKRKLNDLGISDVLPFDRVDRGYPTEKPVDLLSVLVKQSSAPGELVADPFTGSGSTGVASLLAGRRFAGSDMSEKAVDISRRRLAETPFISRIGA